MSMFYRAFLDVFSALIRLVLCVVFAAAFVCAAIEFIRGK